MQKKVRQKKNLHAREQAFGFMIMSSHSLEDTCYTQINQTLQQRSEKYESLTDGTCNQLPHKHNKKCLCFQPRLFENPGICRKQRRCRFKVYLDLNSQNNLDGRFHFNIWGVRQYDGAVSSISASQFQVFQFPQGSLVSFHLPRTC